MYTLAECGHNLVYDIVETSDIGLVVRVQLIWIRSDHVQFQLVGHRQPNAYTEYVYSLLLGLVCEGQGELRKQ